MEKRAEKKYYAQIESTCVIAHDGDAYGDAGSPNVIELYKNFTNLSNEVKKVKMYVHTYHNLEPTCTGIEADVMTAILHLDTDIVGNLNAQQNKIYITIADQKFIVNGKTSFKFPLYLYDKSIFNSMNKSNIQDILQIDLTYFVPRQTNITGDVLGLFIMIEITC